MSILSGSAELPSRLRFNIPAIWILALAGAAAACIPLVYLVVRAAEADAETWSKVLTDGTARLLLNTAGLTLAVTAASAALALPIAYLTERTDLPLARWWRSITIMPLAIPSYVGAFAFIIALGPNGSLQDLLAPLGVESIPEIYGFFGAWLTLTLFTFPYLLIVIRAGLRDLDPGIEEAARSLGQSAWGAFWRVTVPQLRIPLATGSLLVALYVISDFGAVSMMRFDTFTRAIYVRIGHVVRPFQHRRALPDSRRPGCGSAARRLVAAPKRSLPPTRQRCRAHAQTGQPAPLSLAGIGRTDRRLRRGPARAGRGAVPLALSWTARRRDLPPTSGAKRSTPSTPPPWPEPQPSPSRSRSRSSSSAGRDSSRASSIAPHTSATPCPASSLPSR